MWAKAELRTLCEQIVDCPHSTPVWTDSGVVVLRNQNIRFGRLDLSDRSYTDEEHFSQRVRRAEPRAGDLVITREAPMGEVCILPEGLRCCLGQRMVLLRPNANHCDGRFLLYALQSPSVQHEIQINEGTGSTVSNLRIPLLEKLPIPTPDLPEQRAIAGILGALDDKIELNRRMNQTLEEIARTIFTSWFVRFDPVRAKAAARPPDGMDAETAALFPDSFVDSELGQIPAGWKWGALDDEFDITMGQSPPGSTYNQDGTGLPFYQGRADFGDRFPSRRVYCTAPTRFANLGDTLMSVRAPVGDINIAIERCAIGRGVAALRHHSLSVEYSYETMNQLRARLMQFDSEGTVFGSINGNDLRKLPVILPGDRLTKLFEAFCGPNGALIESNFGETATLTAIRDALLPKLLSGELRVPEAVRTLAEVGG